MSRTPISVVCDRCREEGEPGADPFEAFGALLDFDPVPRRTTRADGWDAEVQRAFVAALSLTGSVRQASRAVGKAAFGAEQLLRHEGSEGFRAACEEAMRIAADERSRRLAEGLRTVAAEKAGWRPADPPWAKARSRRGDPPPPEAPTEEEEEALKSAAFDSILRKYAVKVAEERMARLAGDVVAADFCVRQLTHIEVGLDLMSEGRGWELLRTWRSREHHITEIAETPMSRLLGEIRREAWAAEGAPPRPEHPPQRYLVHHPEGYATEPDEVLAGGLPETPAEQARAYQARHAEEAKAQVEWEAEARRDAEARRAEARRREEPPGFGEEPG